MPIHTEIDPARQLTIRKIKGPVTFDEVMVFIRKEYSGDITRNIIVDCSEGTLNSLSSDEMGKIAAFISKESLKRETGKTAGIMPKDVDFGLANMFQALTQIMGYKRDVKIFRHREDAMAWVSENEHT